MMGGGGTGIRAKPGRKIRRNARGRKGMQNRAVAYLPNLFFPDLNVLFTHCAIVTINESRNLPPGGVGRPKADPEVHVCRNAASAFTLDLQPRGNERKIALVALSRGGPVGRAPPQTCDSRGLVF